MPDLGGPGGLVLAAVAWVGHAVLLMGLVNHLYGRDLPKPILRPVRVGAGLLILAFPLLVGAARGSGGAWAGAAAGYGGACVLAGGLWLPAVTAYRRLRPRPNALRAEATDTADYGKELGLAAAAGDGRYAWACRRLPLPDTFRCDFTDLELAVPRLPAAWDGLTILLVTDTHFCGTPGRDWYDRVFARAAKWPAADLLVLGGDYVDTDRHHAWIGPLLAGLPRAGPALAVLGNHDRKHRPDAVRRALAAAGFDVLGNGWKEYTVRGQRLLAVGHEGPWFGPPPDLSAAPAGPFRLCVSHSPDNFYWAARHGVDLVLCGHVHGGQVRVPVVGSIFVPSVYGRRFDQGVFERGPTVMAVNRGLGGKEPFRFRCPAQVTRITLRPGGERGA